MTDYKVLWQQMCERCDELDKKLAQRTWVGLTDEEVEAMQRLAIDPVDANGWGFLNRERYANLIEAKLKEKNT